MSETIVYVPGRIKSAVKGGHATGTEDIYDDELSKTQKEINAEQEGSIAAEVERATEVEELLQSEINGFNSQNYVSVNSYSDLPSLGSVDTIYRVGSWDGTQIDATKYAEYAWKNTGIDQGEYVLLSVKTQVGEVFDISEYHSGATYADLAAALGTNGVNVPEGVRKGGMSVKFVQSSDNKYVQYRLILSTFTATQFTTAANWQGVDNKPVINSPNLTNSDGVAKELGMPIFEKSWTGKEYDFDNLPITLIQGKQYLFKVNSVTAGNDVTVTLTNNLQDEQVFTIHDNDYNNYKWFTANSNKNGITVSISGDSGDISYTIYYDGILPNVSTLKENVSTLEVTNIYDVNEDRGIEVFDTLTNARHAVPDSIRRPGRTITALLSSGERYIGTFMGTNSELNQWWNDALWYRHTNYFLSLGNTNYTNKTTARNAVPNWAKIGLKGLIITYKYYGSYLIEQFIGTGDYATTDASWKKVYPIDDVVGLPNPSVILNDSKSIAQAGTHTVGVCSFSSEQYAICIVKGISGTINFCDSSWVSVTPIYSFTDGVPFLITTKTAAVNYVLRVASAVAAATPVEIAIYSGTVADIIKNLEKSINEKFTEDTETCINSRRTITAGSYRNVQIRMTPLNASVKGVAVLSGMSGKVDFCSKDWVNRGTYIIADGAETNVVIPPHCPNIIVGTTDGTPTQTDINFTLTVKYQKSDYNNHAFLKNEAEREKYTPIFDSLRRTKNKNGIPSTDYKMLLLGVVTDLHDEINGVTNAFAFLTKYKNNMTDIVGMGDYVNGALSDFSNTNRNFKIEEQPLWKDIIKAIGNHDAYHDWVNGTEDYVVDDKTSYDAILKDDIANWGVVYESEKCFFYKDYTQEKVRVIFVDCMHWDEDNDNNGQIVWLRNVLYNDNINSAKAKQLHVIIVVHYFPVSTLSGAFVPMDTSFNTKDADFSTGGWSSILPDIVNEFQTQGGTFVCYLSGHTHKDGTGVYENYPNQINIIQNCTAEFEWHRDSVFTFDTDYDKQLNLFAVDSECKFIKIYRVGGAYDRNMQHRESMLLSYDVNSQNKLLSYY